MGSSSSFASVTDMKIGRATRIRRDQRAWGMRTSRLDIKRQKIAKLDKQLDSLKVQQAQAEATLSSLNERPPKHCRTNCGSNE